MTKKNEAFSYISISYSIAFKLLALCFKYISSPIGQDCTRKGGKFRPIGYDYAGMEGGFYISVIIISWAGLMWVQCCLYNHHN